MTLREELEAMRDYARWEELDWARIGDRRSRDDDDSGAQAALQTASAYKDMCRKLNTILERMDEARAKAQEGEA